MSYIKELMEYSPSAVIVIVLLLIFAVPTIVGQVQKFLAILGRPAVARADKIKRDKEYEDNNRRIDALEERMRVVVDASIKGDAKLQESIDKILEMMQKHIIADNERTTAMLHSTIWRMHGEFMRQGYVTEDGLKTFTRCVEVYKEAGGNSVVAHKLEPEVLSLEIRE